MISNLLRHPLLRAPLRVAAVAAWLVVAVLALASAQTSPRSSTSGEIVMGVAFGSTTLVTPLALRFTKSRWQFVAFTAAAAFLQLSHLLAPDRRASAEEWSCDVVAALTGIVIGRAIDYLSWPLRADA